MTEIRTIGIIGAGRVGTAVARRAVAAGYEVRVASARPAAETGLLLQFTAPGAVAGDLADVIAASDLVVLALPLSRYRSLAPEALAGKIVIDAMNYWPATDGTLADFEGPRASSEVVAAHLPGARVVRSLNHLGYHEIDGAARPRGDADRRAMAVAGDDPAARAAVAGFIDRIGFDPVDAGPLSTARAFAIGSPVFGAVLNQDDLRAALTAPRAA